MRFSPTLCGLVAALVTTAPAEIVINEFVAASSEHLVGTDPMTGERRLGASQSWYAVGFDDLLWSEGSGPFGAGYGSLGVSVSGQIGGNAAAVYLRTRFSVRAVDILPTVLLDIDYDDGFIAYLNGREVARRNMGAPGSFAFHNQPAFNDRNSAGIGTIELGEFGDLLVEGENVFAVQVHDQGDRTLKLDARLRTSGGQVLVNSDASWRYFVGVAEPSGGIYDKVVGGEGGDLELKWTTGSFDQSGWNLGSSPIGYDTSADYPLATDLGGQMRGITPSLYTRFSFLSSAEQNAGTNSISAEVDYDDGFIMYLNGVEIARRNMGAVGTFVPHSASATASHGARWESGNDNPGVLETIAIDPGLLADGENVLAVQLHNVSTGSSDLVFSVIVTTGGANPRTMVGPGNENRYFVGHSEPVEIIPPTETKSPRFTDWVELHNTGPTAVNIAGWSLSDRAGDNGWEFPAPTVIEPGGFLVVLASGKDISEPVEGSPLMHTDFRLNASGEHLGLYDATGTWVSGFVGEYPPQSFHHSYGRGGSGEMVYFDRATPGTSNAVTEFDRIVTAPEIGPETGFYGIMPDLALSPLAPEVVVRVTTDGSDPTETNGRIYTGGALSGSAEFAEGPVGTILRESWYGITSPSIDSIPLDAPPGLRSNIAGLYAPTNSGNNFGTRIHGWLHPPRSGDYTFWIACDQRGEVWLSSDASPSNAVRIAHAPGPTASGEYDLYPEQQSVPITLAAGDRYYISVLHKESTGNDHLRVQWEGPGVLRDTVRSGFLSPVVPEMGQNGADTVVVKARAFAAGAIPSKITTRTYAIGYDPDMHHGPALFLSGDEERVFFAPDGATTIIGGSYDDNNRWVANDVENDYNFAMAEGRPFERKATIEIVMPDGTLGRRTGLGVRVAGSPHARPHYRALNPSSNWLGSWTSKPSLNFFFRDDYGDESLDLSILPDQALGGFGTMRLRAGKNDSSNPFTRDEVMRRISWATGQVASRGVFSNLWINGHHKAYFNLTERLREPFFQRHYETDVEWDIWHIREIVEGDRIHYDATMNLLRNQPMSVDANYAAAEARVDMANYIDYIITNTYGATGDWPHNNYNLSRPRIDGGRWTFNIWDAEGSFGTFGNNVNTNTLTEELGGSPSGDSHMSRLVYRACKSNAEFRLLFADRINQHFFNGGGLTQANLSTIFDEVYAEFEPIYRAVRGGQPDRSYFDNWLPSRRGIIFSHFQGENLWPATSPPNFSQHGGAVAPGFALAISGAPAGGAIYYTTDGTDPRMRGGAVSGQSYTASFRIDRTTLVKARARSAAGQWSALTEAIFAAPDPPALAITEIHFNPDGDDATEFVELQNLGATAIDLSGIHFSSGLKFTFTSGTLAPGERLVLVRDATAFGDAYPGVTIGGVFEDGALDNGGEQLVLSEVGGRMIVEADYNDWLDAADGGGFSLVLVPGADASIKSSWVSEYVSGGTPGAATITAFAADPDADLDGDGLSDLLEYALATDPLVATPSPWIFGADRISIDWNIAAHDIDFMVEVSTDGRNWSEAAGEVTLLGDGRANTMLLVGDGLLLVRARCQLR